MAQAPQQLHCCRCHHLCLPVRCCQCTQLPKAAVVADLRMPAGSDCGRHAGAVVFCSPTVPPLLCRHWLRWHRGSGVPVTVSLTFVVQATSCMQTVAVLLLLLKLPAPHLCICVSLKESKMIRACAHTIKACLTSASGGLRGSAS